MIGLDRANDNIDDVWKATTTFPVFFQRMEYFSRDDELPGVLIQKIENDLLNLAARNDIAVAD